VKRFSEFHFTAKFSSFKLKMPFRMAGRDKNSSRHFFKSDKNSMKFFHKTASQGLFRCFLPTSSTFAATAATCPLKLKKLSFCSCKRLREMVYYQKFK